MLKKFFAELKGGITPTTWWPHEEVGSNKEASLHTKVLFGEQNVFATPKPEKLLSRILDLSTQPGDLVLDSFAGSGTTGAVAQKMGRRWIMVELGEHCHTHIVPRLKKVLDGQDVGGVTSAVGWKGGGSFRYLRLAPSLLKRDTWGHWVINPAYNAEMLAEAMCKHMGFIYAPSAAHFWQHGHSTESAFIYVTTGSLSHEQLAVISEAVGPERSLLICCKAFMAEANAYANLSIKKIPKAVLQKCEWDHDDYSFSIDVLASPSGPPDPDTDTDPDIEPGTEDDLSQP
jgi:adenine-specific DNA-methyltransferase